MVKYESRDIERAIIGLNQLFANDSYFKKRGTFPLLTVDDVFLSAADGILLARMALLVAPGVLPFRRLYSEIDLSYFRSKIDHPTHQTHRRQDEPDSRFLFQLSQNFNLICGAFQRLPDCSVPLVKPEDVLALSYSPVLGAILGLLRGVIMAKVSLAHHPCLVRLAEEKDDETMETVTTLVTMEPQRLLIRWLNYHLRKDGSPLIVTNLYNDLKDLEVILCVLRQIIPDDVSIDRSSITRAVGASSMGTRASFLAECLIRLGCTAPYSADELLAAEKPLFETLIASLLDRAVGIQFPKLGELAELEEQNRQLMVKIRELEALIEQTFNSRENFQRLNEGLEKERVISQRLEEKVELLSQDTLKLEEELQHLRDEKLHVEQEKELLQLQLQDEHRGKRAGKSRGKAKENQESQENQENQGKESQEPHEPHEPQETPEALQQDDQEPAAAKRSKKDKRKKEKIDPSSGELIQESSASSSSPPSPSSHESGDDEASPETPASQKRKNLKGSLQLAEDRIRSLEAELVQYRPGGSQSATPLPPTAPTKQGSEGPELAPPEEQEQQEQQQQQGSLLSSAPFPHLSEEEAVRFLSGPLGSKFSKAMRKGGKRGARQGARSLAIVAMVLMEVTKQLEQGEKVGDVRQLMEQQMVILEEVQQQNRRTFAFF